MDDNDRIADVYQIMQLIELSICRYDILDYC